MESIPASITLDGGEQEYLDSRMRDLERASERSRWFYLVTSLISLLLISVSYNQFISWSRLMADGTRHVSVVANADRTRSTTAPGTFEDVPKAPAQDHCEERTFAEFNEKCWPDQMTLLQMKEWVSGLQFDLPYLGGRFSASDAGIVGGMLLLIASLWGYFALKRENHIVYFLIKDVAEFQFSEEARFYVRNQLYATQLFIGNHTRPFKSDNILDPSYRLYLKYKEKERSKVVKRIKEALTFVAANIVFGLPALALLGVLIVDASSLKYSSPFRASTEPLIRVLAEKGLLHQAYGRLAASALLLAIVARITYLAFKYQMGTIDLVRLSGKWKYPVVNFRAEPDNLRDGHTTDSTPPPS
ncbi:MAG: hypothetical protein DI564_05690 [Rhodanobacter denitrificans]|uniref:Uncharacterized protein n=1 Tax=Rhodanobacter denitrificans TaxID=666685 RepID=A0A2W5KRA4_9GAMM|nr:MAG: hypothetical protein DI564_05690 [Rhodanobacter denitrificans]